MSAPQQGYLIQALNPSGVPTTLTCDVSGNLNVTGGGGGGGSFSGITAGTNAYALVVGTGGSITVSGTGTINATSLNLTGTETLTDTAGSTGTQGQILMATPTGVKWVSPSNSTSIQTARSIDTSFTQAGVTGPTAVTFTTPFLDTSYTVQITVIGDDAAPGTPTVAQFPSLGISYATLSATGVNVWVANNDSIAHTGVIHVTAIHD